ncbi:MAG: LppP/LprE family lipoprotein [Elainellaceae cyanobacterium]
MKRLPPLKRIAVLFGIALALPITVGTTALAQSYPSGDWLDETINWNSPDGVIPSPIDIGGNNLEQCALTIRPAALPEDQIVEAAGWTLTGAAQIYGGTTIVTSMSDTDGMCRPLGYQVFVFVGGDFAGTLSPIPMDSRTDGSLFQQDLYREDFLAARFNRYSPEDPLCCASGESRLFYEIEYQGDAAVLVPQFPADTVQGTER